MTAVRWVAACPVLLLVAAVALLLPRVLVALVVLFGLFFSGLLLSPSLARSVGSYPSGCCACLCSGLTRATNTK